MQPITMQESINTAITDTANTVYYVPSCAYNLLDDIINNPIKYLGFGIVGVATVGIINMIKINPALQKGLVLHLPLDQQSYDPETNMFTDMTPYVNYGTSHNVPVFTTDQMGKSNRATMFNGTDDYIDCGNDVSLNLTDAITISAWVNPNAGWSNHDRIVEKQPDSGECPYVLDLTNNHWRGYVVFTDEDYVVAEGTTAVTAGTWHHVVFIYDGSQAYIYVNGVLDGTSILRSKTIKTSTMSLLIGSSTAANYFNGAMDEFRIYDHALSSDEITSLYNQYRPKLVA